MKFLLRDDPGLFDLVQKEEFRLENTLDLIAAESHAPRSILEVLGSVLNTKTIEGYPGRRFHGGCIHVDEIERLAVSRCEELFGAEHANVQPHSGTSANLGVYFSVLNVGDKILSMALPHGGHLSHGHFASITSKCFQFEHYGVDPKTELIDYGEMADLAEKFQPKMIVVGASSYPRLIDYEKISKIAEKASAYLLTDMAHIAGLVAGKVIPSPVPFSDFVTFTCYKTMLGGRGGVILCKKEHGKMIDRTIFPGCQGTSAVNFIAAKALAFKLASEPAFEAVQRKIVQNAESLAAHLAQAGYRIVTGGTGNHQVIVDVSSKGIAGNDAEKALEAAGIIANRNVIPTDAGTPGKTSGVRLGTTAVTARKMKEAEMPLIAEMMDMVLTNMGNQEVTDKISRDVRELCRRFPVYPKG